MASWYFKSLIWDIFSGFPLAVILLCLVLSPYLVYLRIFLCVRTHLLVKMDSTEEAYGYNIPWHHSPLTSKEPFCACVVREVSWLREWEIWGMTRAQLPPLIILLFLSWEFRSTGNEFPIALLWLGAHLPPASAIGGWTRQRQERKERMGLI